MSFDHHLSHQHLLLFSSILFSSLLSVLVTEKNRELREKSSLNGIFSRHKQAMPISSFFSSLPSIPLPSFVSLIPLYESYLKLRFTHHLGLSSRVVEVSPSTSLHFWSAAAPRDRPVLVLLHGFGPTASALHQFPVGLLRDLSERFRLVIPDLLFFHPGSTTTSSDRSELSQAAAIVGLLDAIHVEQFHLLGTSYGGFVACRVASTCGTERVGKVVVASSGVNMRRRNNEELARKAGVEHVEEVLMPETPARLRRLLELAVWSPKISRILPDFALGDALNKMYLPNRKEKLELLKGLTLGRDDTPNITPLKQDVLLIWGEEDQLFPLEMALELKEILGKKVKLEVIRKTSHVPQIEHPKKFGKLVIDFLCGSEQIPSNSQRVRL